ncbi:MAG TPA: 2-dehydropantoate 2-reductase [Lactobacillus sp.]|nr:2-dehydropantoate 2-reductase [Lactobacillus sp.]
MKIAIAGAGAMGSRFGKMLQDSGQTVTLIDNWAAHVSQIQKHGLLVHTDGQEQIVKFEAFQPSELNFQQFDLIILFTKAMQMEGMLQDIQKAIGHNTKILVLANGIGNIETIEHFIPRKQIIAGVTVWSSELDGPGEITLTGTGSVTLQAVQPDDNNALFLQQLVTLMNNAKLNVTVSNSVIEAIWKKAAFNCVLNTYTSLISCNVGEFGAFSNRDFLIDNVLNEITSVAKAMKVPFNKQETLDLILSQFKPGQNGSHYASMYQDLSQNRLTEIDYLNGYIAKKGAEFHIPTPVNSLLTALIHCREELNQMQK